MLYERPGGRGGLRVLLTTRSKELRSHPGQTALPGGKVDKTDAGVVETAVSVFLQLCPHLLCARWSLISVFLVLVDTQFREANEEVAFPLCSPHVHTLCTLEPFISPNRVLVTPVIAFLDNTSVLEELRAEPREVAGIFDHPLEALLDPELLRDSEEKLVPLGSEHWPYDTELHVSYTSHILRLINANHSETELFGRLLAGHYVSHASFPEHRLACEGADSRYSGKYPPCLLNSYPGLPSVDETAPFIYV